MHKALLAFAPALLVLAAAASPAAANSKLETIMQDDRVFPSSYPRQQGEALNTADALGVDTIHSVIQFHSIAPDVHSPTKPSGFNAADPRAYPAAKWDRFDSMVRGASARGIQVLFTPSGKVPRWASSCKRVTEPTPCGPKVADYQAFFTAVVKRYNGSYVDENQGGGRLPKVKRFSAWNEPNQKGWLRSSTSKRTTAGLYRNLFYAAEKAIVKGGQRRAHLYIGEAAPLKSLRFYEALMCIDSRGRPLRGSTAKKNGCKSGKRIRQLKANGVAHHPYARGGSSPFKRTKSYDITMRDIARVRAVFNRGAKRRAVKRNLPVYVTEFGAATNPPSEKYGMSLSAQMRELNRAEYHAWRNPTVKSYAQYQLSDDTNLGQGGEPVIFQTGLRFGDNRPKPSFDAFRMPIFVVRKGSRAVVWGGVRPGARTRVRIQVGPPNGTYRTVRTVTVNRYGYINTKIKRPSSKRRVRLLWTAPGGTQHTSRQAKVESRP